MLSAAPSTEWRPPAHLLALDLGTSTGWAIRTPPGAIASGTVEFRSGRFEGGGMRFVRFAAWLRDLPGPFDAVFFEEVRSHRGTDAAHAYGGFLAHLSAWCEAEGIPYRGVPVATIKRHATGKGNADKAAMMAAAVAAGFRPGDDNEADALHLLRWGLKEHGVAAPPAA
ncbi:MAG: hypothetical protein H6842_04635 [Rhodospirillaceae bacterium]|nr:hypothetical protein [Rhodospirillaceae bacterium]